MSTTHNFYESGAQFFESSADHETKVTWLFNSGFPPHIVGLYRDNVAFKETSNSAALSILTNLFQSLYFCHGEKGILCHCIDNFR